MRLQAALADSDKSWTVDVQDIDKTTFDLSVKNPNKAEEETLREPEDILPRLRPWMRRAQRILERHPGDAVSLGWQSGTRGHLRDQTPEDRGQTTSQGLDLVSFVPMGDLRTDRKFLKPRSERPFDQVSGNYTYFADGDVLLAKITPCFENGKLGIAGGLTNGIGFGSSEYIVFRPRAGLSSEYLYYFLSQDSFRAEGIKSMGGAVGHKRVSKDFIERTRIPIPPLAEQKRIVALLDEAFAGLETAAANTEKNSKTPTSYSLAI